MDTRTYIRDNYDCILAKAKTMKNFDEDVFHDTIMYLIINSERFTEATIYNYIIHSLKVNFIRELQYARNRTCSDVPDTVVYCDTHDIDMSIIINKIKNKFGEDLSNCYLLHKEGYTIDEIKANYPHITSLRKKIKTIENYIRDIIK
jgi:hypothetical protein